MFPAKDLDLVTEHHDLEVSAEPIACESQTEDGADHQIEEREQHPRILGTRWSGGESAFRYPSGCRFVTQATLWKTVRWAMG